MVHLYLASLRHSRKCTNSSVFVSKLVRQESHWKLISSLSGQLNACMSWFPWSPVSMNSPDEQEASRPRLFSIIRDSLASDISSPTSDLQEKMESWPNSAAVR